MTKAVAKAVAKASAGTAARSAVTGKLVKVSPRTVQAARLRQTLNTRLGKPTSPVTTKIANVGR